MDKHSAFIKRVSIKNYKKFSELNVEFTKGLNILVGPNNAGKTTLLEALDLILGERNFSPLSVSRALFHKYEFGKQNNLILVAEIEFPKSTGSSNSEINFVKQLKLGKGTSRSVISRLVSNTEVSVTDILKGKDLFSSAIFENNTPKDKDIKNIFLVTEISVDQEFNSNVEYKIILNVNNGGIVEAWQLVGITGTQRSNIINYLFLDASRIDNKPLTEINEFNWLGRYLKGFLKKNKLFPDFNQDSKKIVLDPKYSDKIIQETLSEIFGRQLKIKLDIFNGVDSDSLIKALKYFIDDGYNDELNNKGQGIQSISLISLFLAWGKFRSEQMPKNTTVNKLWNTLLLIEEPESHFHLPIRNKLISFLRKEFIDQGSQIILSTHDSTFTDWEQSSVMNLVFPNSKDDNFNVKTINVSLLNDDYLKRFIRFNGKSFFTDFILLVEGSEEVCLEQISTNNDIDSFGSVGISISRCVGGIRSTDNPNQDKSALGGKDDALRNIAIYKSIGISTIMLFDIDILFADATTLKTVYKTITGKEFPVDFKFEYTKDAGTKEYNQYRKWWNDNKNDITLINVINEFNNAGIFFFPGDFESIFKEDFLDKFEIVEKGISKINKEKHVYDTKYMLEIDPSNTIFDEENIEYYKNTVNKIIKFVEHKRNSPPIIEDTNDIVDKELPNALNDLPF